MTVKIFSLPSFMAHSCMRDDAISLANELWQVHSSSATRRSCERSSAWRQQSLPQPPPPLTGWRAVWLPRAARLCLTPSIWQLWGSLAAMCALRYWLLRRPPGRPLAAQRCAPLSDPPISRMLHPANQVQLWRSLLSAAPFDARPGARACVYKNEPGRCS